MTIIEIMYSSKSEDVERSAGDAVAALLRDGASAPEVIDLVLLYATDFGLAARFSRKDMEVFYAQSAARSEFERNLLLVEGVVAASGRLASCTRNDLMLAEEEILSDALEAYLEHERHDPEGVRAKLSLALMNVASDTAIGAGISEKEMLRWLRCAFSESLDVVMQEFRGQDYDAFLASEFRFIGYQ